MTNTPNAQTGTEAKAAERAERKVQVGVVTSNKRDKTVTVVTDRLVRHGLYEKFVRRRTKLHAHDEKNEANVGDKVELMASRPLSKLKRWRLVKVLVKAKA